MVSMKLLNLIEIVIHALLESTIIMVASLFCFSFACAQISFARDSPHWPVKAFGIMIIYLPICQYSTIISKEIK